MSKILITGGAGYLGSTLVPFLLANNHELVVVDNFMFGQTPLNHVCCEENLTIINGDVRRKDVIAPLIKKADVIIPLAAFVGAPLCDKDPLGATSINFEAVRMMLELKDSSQIIIMPTTNSAYGQGDENNHCTEESPLNPISQYAVEKVRVEKMLMDHENVVSFRLATVFGMSPRMRLDLLVNDFVYRAVNDRVIVLFESNFKRNYIHVTDVARAFSHCIENFEDMRGEIFNVGLSSANLSKLELCELIQVRIPELLILQENHSKDPDQRNYIVSNAKLEATGWEASVSIDQGIRELIKGFTYLKKSGHGNV